MNRWLFRFLQKGRCHVKKQDVKLNIWQVSRQVKKKRASEWNLWAVVFQRAEVSPLSRYHDLRDSKMRRRTGGVAVLSLSLSVTWPYPAMWLFPSRSSLSPRIMPQVGWVFLLISGFLIRQDCKLILATAKGIKRVHLIRTKNRRISLPF